MPQTSAIVFGYCCSEILIASIHSADDFLSTQFLYQIPVVGSRRFGSLGAIGL